MGSGGVTPDNRAATAALEDNNGDNSEAVDVGRLMRERVS